MNVQLIMCVWFGFLIGVLFGASVIYMILRKKINNKLSKPKPRKFRKRNVRSK